MVCVCKHSLYTHAKKGIWKHSNQTAHVSPLRGGEWWGGEARRGVTVCTVCVCVCVCVCVLDAQLCPTLCNSIDCSLPGSSVHEILQAIIILEWVAIPFSRGFPRPRDWTRVSCIAGRFFTFWATWEALAPHTSASFECYMMRMHM